MYTIKQASARSGVAVPLLRAWERRYGVVAPDRTASGYRLYDEEAIQRLAAMRGLIGAGWAAQQAADQVRDADLETLAGIIEDARPASAAPPVQRAPANTPSAAEQLAHRLVVAARDLDASAFESTLDEAFGTARFEAVADTILMPALRAIGDAWASGELSVAAEHAASQAVHRRLAMAYEAAAAPTGSRPVLVGLGPGARHELGALAFATAARRAGMPILYLGPDLPAESWASAAVERNARAAVIGVPTRADLTHAREVLVRLNRALPRMFLAAGGSQAARTVEGTTATALPEALADSVGSLRRALERRTASPNPIRTLDT